MKPFKKIISVAGSVVMAAVTALSFVGCKPESVDPGKDDDTVHKYRPNVTAKVSDPETRALVMSISTPDGVFNPFFSTAATTSRASFKIGNRRIMLIRTEPHTSLLSKTI